MNLFQTLKKLDITAIEFMEAPDMFTDSMKIMWILTFKAIKKARKIHAMRARRGGLTDRGLLNV